MLITDEQPLISSSWVQTAPENRVRMCVGHSLDWKTDEMTGESTALRLAEDHPCMTSRPMPPSRPDAAAAIHRLPIPCSPPCLINGTEPALLPSIRTALAQGAILASLFPQFATQNCTILNAPHVETLKTLSNFLPIHTIHQTLICSSWNPEPCSHEEPQEKQKTKGFKLVPLYSTTSDYPFLGFCHMSLLDLLRPSGILRGKDIGIEPSCGRIENCKSFIRFRLPSTGQKNLLGAVRSEADILDFDTWGIDRKDFRRSSA
jgi:hypothetical protein